MAADTRPYKSKEQDGQGNEVIIRDQQLVEQSTVTTMPSGACFETFDIDGRPVKIPRDNMISIVLECMGIVLNDSSKNLGTNVNKALGLQGNNIGNVTVSDLASVLGVAYFPLYEEKTISTNQQTAEMACPGVCFIFAIDSFYNGFAAIWYKHGSELSAIYEQRADTLSVVTTSARCYVTAENLKIKITNNYGTGNEIAMKFRVMTM